jgi:hypothetical protein
LRERGLPDPRFPPIYGVQELGRGTVSFRSVPRPGLDCSSSVHRSRAVASSPSHSRCRLWIRYRDLRRTRYNMLVRHECTVGSHNQVGLLSTAASRRLTSGRTLARGTASSTPAAFPRTPSTPTSPGGRTSRYCTSSRTGTGPAWRGRKSRCGSIRTWIVWSCSSMVTIGGQEGASGVEPNAERKAGRDHLSYDHRTRRGIRGRKLYDLAAPAPPATSRG